MGNTKANFLRPRNTSSTLVKFELFCHGIPMLKLGLTQDENVSNNNCLLVLAIGFGPRS